MANKKVRISTYWLLIIVIISLIILPIYPCKVDVTGYSGFEPINYETIHWRPIYEIMYHDFNWTYSHGAMGYWVEYNYHGNSLLITLEFAIIISLIALIFYYIDKKSFKSGFLNLNLFVFTSISIINGLIIFISIYTWYNYFKINEFFNGPTPIAYWILFTIAGIIIAINFIYLIILNIRNYRVPPTGAGPRTIFF